MPIYLFKHPDTDETIEVVQKMNDAHVYADENDVEWERVWVAPNSSVDAKLDGSLESFMKYTEGKKGSMGDIWDASREASEIREKRKGEDGVKKKHFKEYSKKRNGMKHQRDKD